MMGMYFWGAVLRFLQIVVQAAPTILVGLLITGVFRRLLGTAQTRRLFGDGTWRSLPTAWLLGMLLPVCSLGVLPVVREMRRAGVSGGAILAFALTAPLFNPVSLLYGLTLSAPVVIFTFALCSLLIVSVCGLIWDRWLPAPTEPDADDLRVGYGLRRILAVGLVAVREAWSGSLVYILIGVLGAASLSVLLPCGSLQRAAEHGDTTAPLMMAAVALPAYATPMTAMMQLASMFQHGNSVGAAFTLLVLGAGANLGLVALLCREFGVRRSLCWLGLLVVIVLGLAYALDEPLYPHGVDPAGHTHAFDTYCCPFNQPTNYLQVLRREVREKILPHELISLDLLATLIVSGAVLAWADPRRRIELWLARDPQKLPRYDKVVPAPVLGVVTLAGLVALSVVGCYIYYPDPDEVFEEMQVINAEVVAAAMSHNWEAAEHWIPIYEDWSRKLEIGAVLRGQPVNGARHQCGERFRDALEQLEHAMHDRQEEARELGLVLNRAYRQLRAAYQDRIAVESPATDAAGRP